MAFLKVREKYRLPCISLWCKAMLLILVIKYENKTCLCGIFKEKYIKQIETTFQLATQNKRIRYGFLSPHLHHLHRIIRNQQLNHHNQSRYFFIPLLERDDRRFIRSISNLSAFSAEEITKKRIKNVAVESFSPNE